MQMRPRAYQAPDLDTQTLRVQMSRQDSTEEWRPIPGWEGLYDDDPIVVRTKVVCEMDAAGLTFRDVDEVDVAVYGAKEIAKASFFAFASEETHDIMGVVLDAGDETERS
jgi:hypothetical protein